MSRKKALVSVVGNYSSEGPDQTESDSYSLRSVGTFKEHANGYEIVYEEMLSEHEPATLTTVTVSDDGMVIINRAGEHTSQLIIEKGARHICQYGTEYGDLLLGISSDIVENNLHAHGGNLKLRYELDINNMSMSINEIEITVKEYEK